MSVKRFTAIFFVLLILLWTSLYIALYSDSATFENTEYEETFIIIYRILIFPVHDIFFQKDLENPPIAVLIGYSLNILLYAFAIEYLLSQVIRGKRNVNYEEHN